MTYYQAQFFNCWKRPTLNAERRTQNISFIDDSDLSQLLQFLKKKNPLVS